MARVKKPRSPASHPESDPRRLAYLAFALGGFLLAWVLSHIIEDGWALAWSYWPWLQRVNVLAANMAAIVIALAATIAAILRESWRKFMIEVVEQVSQVTWPTKAETRAATGVVVAMTFICSGILWTMDTFWATVTDWLYGA